MTDITDRYNEIVEELEHAHTDWTDPRIEEWNDNPEPMKNELDPRTMVDCNIDGQAWLWNTESEAHLVYEGEPMEIER